MVMPEIVSLGVYNSNSASKGTGVSKIRKTYMFEIELPIDEGGISYIDSASMPIFPDVMIVAKPGQSRHTKFPFKSYYIHIILHEGVLYDSLMNIPDFLKIGNPDAYKSIYTRMFKHVNDFRTPSKNSEIILQSLVLELIYNLCEDAALQINLENSGTGIKRIDITMLENIYTYIKDNLTEDLSLEKIAELAHLSPIHFHNIFKTATGITLRKYVEEQRIKKAIILLTTTDYTLTKIAFECGFSSQSYFSYVFKRKLKKTPREYVQEFFNRYKI